MDGHGVTPLPPTGSPGDSTHVWAPTSAAPLSVGVLGEYASSPLVQVLRVGDEVTPTRILDDLGGGTLSARGQIAPWLGLGVSLPVWLGATGEAGNGGLGLGDLRLAAPLGLIVEGPVGLALVPALRLPTGASDRFLGDGATGGSGVVAATARADVLRLGLQAGVETHPDADEPLVTNGSAVTGAAAVGVVPLDALGVHLEVVGARWLEPDEVGQIPMPIEGGLSVRGTAGPLWWSAGATTALTSGPGAAGARAYLGLGWALERAVEDVVVPEVAAEEPEVQPEPPVGVDVALRTALGEVVDASVVGRGPEGAEVAVDVTGGSGTLELVPGAWQVSVSADGYGTQRRTVLVEAGGAAPRVDATLLERAGDEVLSLRVVDAQGAPVSGAALLLEGLPVGATSSGGDLVLEGVAEGSAAVEARAHGYREALVAALAGAASEETLVLWPVVGSVRVTVRGPDGPAPDAAVHMVGPERQRTEALDATGTGSFVLAPGRWRLVATSPSLGVQERLLEIAPDQRDALEVRFELLPAHDGGADLSVVVADVAGLPVSDVDVRIDGALAGRSSSGGSLVMRDLEPGVRRLELAAADLRPVPARDVLLGPGIREELYALSWQPGTVRVRVHADGQPVPDAVLRGSGPGELAARPLGPLGVLTTQLAAGSWELVVTSERHGVQSRAVSVPEDSVERIEVDIGMVAGSGAPLGDATADLSVRVADPEGAVVPRARVRVDGVDHGATAPDGGIEIAWLEPGSRALEVLARPYAPEARSVTLPAGGRHEERVALSWGAGAVDVRGRHPGGPVGDGVVRFAGASGSSPPLALGPEGRAVAHVAPGTWQAVLLSPAHGVATAALDVPPDAGLLRLDLVVEPVGPGATLLLRVEDPTGRPVAATRAWDLPDGRDLSAPGSVLLLDGLPPGPARFRVSAEHHAETEVQATLEEGLQQRVVRVEPIPSQLRLSVRDADGAPVAARAQLQGRYPVDEVAIGASGVASVALNPGAWTAVVQAEGYGAQQRDLVVEPGVDAVLELVVGSARVARTAVGLTIAEQVHFDTGLATLRPESGPILDEVASTLRAHPDVRRIEVQGHTDTVGGIALNQRLSQARADAVRAALVARGVEPGRAVARGFGPTQPVASNETPEGRQQNRRVAFRILDGED